MKHGALFDTRFFFATASLPCPYLPGRVERRVVTELVGRDADKLHDRLTLAGFRRSHAIVYAPACPNCQACVAVRIRAGEFKPSRSLKRIGARNANLRVNTLPASATAEQYHLFKHYQDSRHDGGDMAKMDFNDYRALIEDTPVDSTVVEFRATDGELVAACLMDQVDDGLSAVYSFFDPEFSADSLGTYMILWMVAEARRRGLPHVYLGFWIDGCSKMSYKARFQPLEMRTPDGWVPHVSETGPFAGEAAADEAPGTT